MAFDDFEAQIQSDEFAGEDFSHLCPNCGTDHATLDDQEYCDMLREQEDAENKVADYYEDYRWHNRSRLN